MPFTLKKEEGQDIALISKHKPLIANLQDIEAKYRPYVAIWNMSHSNFANVKDLDNATYAAAQLLRHNDILMLQEVEEKAAEQINHWLHDVSSNYQLSHAFQAKANHPFGNLIIWDKAKYDQVEASSLSESEKRFLAFCAQSEGQLQAVFLKDKRTNRHFLYVNAHRNADNKKFNIVDALTLLQTVKREKGTQNYSILMGGNFNEYDWASSNKDGREYYRNAKDTLTYRPAGEHSSFTQDDDGPSISNPVNGVFYSHQWIELRQSPAENNVDYISRLRVYSRRPFNDDQVHKDFHIQSLTASLNHIKVPPDGDCLFHAMALNAIRLVHTGELDFKKTAIRAAEFKNSLVLLRQDLMLRARSQSNNAVFNCLNKIYDFIGKNHNKDPEEFVQLFQNKFITSLDKDTEEKNYKIVALMYAIGAVFRRVASDADEALDDPWTWGNSDAAAEIAKTFGFQVNIYKQEDNKLKKVNADAKKDGLPEISLIHTGNNPDAYHFDCLAVKNDNFWSLLGPEPKVAAASAATATMPSATTSSPVAKPTSTEKKKETIEPKPVPPTEVPASDKAKTKVEKDSVVPNPVAKPTSTEEKKEPVEPKTVKPTEKLPAPDKTKPETLTLEPAPTDAGKDSNLFKPGKVDFLADKNVEALKKICTEKKWNVTENKSADGKLESIKVHKDARHFLVEKNRFSTTDRHEDTFTMMIQTFRQQYPDKKITITAIDDAAKKQAEDVCVKLGIKADQYSISVKTAPVPVKKPTV